MIIPEALSSSSPQCSDRVSTCGQFVLFLYLLPPSGIVNADEKNKKHGNSFGFSWTSGKTEHSTAWVWGANKFHTFFCGQILTQLAKNFIWCFYKVITRHGRRPRNLAAFSLVTTPKHSVLFAGMSSQQPLEIVFYYEFENMRMSVILYAVLRTCSTYMKSY